MNTVIKWSLKNSIAVFLLVLIVLVSGVIVTGNIKLETFPNVSNPVLTVQAKQPGATAEDIEKNVTKPIEDTVKRLNDYENFTSTSGENSANVMITYPFGTVLDEKERQLDSALSKLSLPKNAEVQVNRIKLEDFPIYQAALSSKDGTALQTLLEDKIIPELEQTKGISSVQLKGKKTPEVEIVVNLDKAEEKGLDLNSIKKAIQDQNYSLPAGSAEKDGNTIAVRLVGELQKAADLKEIKISTSAMSSNLKTGRKAGQTFGQLPSSRDIQPNTVKLGDIAEIKTVSEQTEINKVNGNDAFLIEVTKDQAANTTDVTKSVRDILSKYLQKEHFDITPILDQGKLAEDSVAGLIREALYGALFVVVIIALFLRNVRATIIALISLPLSILATLSILESMDYTLNIMTLGGMAVAVGRIVDDSIVVIENIFRWKQQKGNQFPNKKLAYHATKEMIRAVASSTFVTVVVFLPIAFVNGMIGQFFRPFAVSVVVSILVSLLVAIMLIPVLGASFLKKVKHGSYETVLTRAYENLLRGALRKKAWVMVVSILLLLGSFAFTPFIGFSFLPTGGSDLIQADITLPTGTTMQAEEELAKKVDDQMKEMGIFTKRQMTVGVPSDKGFRRQQQTDQQTISFTLELKKGISTNDTLEKVETEASKLVGKEYPNAKVNVKETHKGGPPSGSNLDIKLSGDNLNDLEKAAGQVENLLKQNKELKNVSNNMQNTRLAWEVTLNDKGKELGISPDQVMALINERLQPKDTGTYKLDGTDQSLVLLYDQKISSETQLKEIKIDTPNGKKELQEIADIKTANVPVAILHENGKTYAQVSAEIKGNNTFTVSDKMSKDIQSLPLPKEIQVKVGGGRDDLKEGFTSLGITIAVAIGLVFLILSVTFGGLITPMVILSSLLFVPIGALTGLLLTGQSLSMSAMIGFLMLVGIVVTNAIVLLDRVEDKRKSGMELNQALVDAAKTRLRPILMTAIATICALMPLALSGGSSELLISQGLAITVIGGLTTSTLLTLIFVPVLYAIVGKYRRIENNGFDLK